MSNYFPATSFGTNTGTTANNYNWLEAGTGLFSDALGAWVQIESMKHQAGSSAASQQATRDATTYHSGHAPNMGGFVGGGGGVSPGVLLIGGAALVGLVLLLK